MEVHFGSWVMESEFFWELEFILHIYTNFIARLSFCNSDLVLFELFAVVQLMEIINLSLRDVSNKKWSKMCLEDTSVSVVIIFLESIVVDTPSKVWP